jgi:quercetin dioxygenase-like cupin family protein
MDKDTLRKNLEEKGFPHIYEWHDDAGTEYPVHAHKGEVSMYIIDGGLTFWFGDEEKLLSAGDYFEVPVGKEHTAKVGNEGCTFLVGEMIEGDS